METAHQERGTRAAQQRQRRTERQRERRERERICGYCRRRADVGLIDWAGRGSPLRIPICCACRGRLGWQLARDGPDRRLVPD